MDKKKKSETHNVRTKFYYYVLVEYPISRANQALLSKIQQDEILSTQEAADAAMLELEAEISKKKRSLNGRRHKFSYQKPIAHRFPTLKTVAILKLSIKPHSHHWLD